VRKDIYSLSFRESRVANTPRRRESDALREPVPERPVPRPVPQPQLGAGPARADRVSGPGPAHPARGDRVGRHVARARLVPLQGGPPGLLQRRGRGADRSPEAPDHGLGLPDPALRSRVPRELRLHARGDRWYGAGRRHPLHDGPDPGRVPDASGQDPVPRRYRLRPHVDDPEQRRRELVRGLGSHAMATVGTLRVRGALHFRAGLVRWRG